MTTPALWLLAIMASVSAADCGSRSPAPVRPHGLSTRPTSDATRIDSMVAALMRARDIPGAAVAVLRGDTVVHSRGYGVADLNSRAEVAGETVFQIASATKPFTAMLILVLAEEGRVGLDEPAAGYLPWLRDRYPTVTVRQLLTHTAGVPRDLRTANIDEFSIDEFRRRFLDAQPGAAPGARWEYANAGYTLLALIAEEVTGEPFGELLESRIFGPLGMRRTGYRVPRQADAGHARGYEWVEGRLEPAPHVFSGWGNSGIESTVEDLARWAAALERGLLLSPESYRVMFERPELREGAPLAFAFRDDPAASYGLGWFLTRYGSRAEQSHGGAIAGFSSMVLRVPEARTTVLVLSNGKDRGDRRAQAELIARGVLDIVMHTRP